MTDNTNSVTDALQPVAWIRKNGIRFNAEAEPQDDSETALYSQTAIDTLRAQLTEAQKVQGQLLDALTSVMLCERNSMSSRAEMVRITRAAIDAAKGESA